MTTTSPSPAQADTDAQQDTCQPPAGATPPHDGWPAWDGTARMTEDEIAGLAEFWAAYEPADQPGTWDEWAGAAVAAGNDQPDPAFDRFTAAHDAEDRSEAAVRERAAEAERLARDEYEASQETTFFTRVFGAIGGRR